jgi:hypothetical protein
MPRHALKQLPGPVVVREFIALLEKNRTNLAQLLAYLGEIDARRLYLPRGHASTYRYCVDEFHMSEGTAFKRIRAARLVRRFPIIYDAVAEGRIHLAALILLSKHLTSHNILELLAAAAHRSKRQVEQLLAERFPQRDVPTVMRAIPASVASLQLSPVTAEPPHAPEARLELSPGTVPALSETGPAAKAVPPLAPPAKLVPIAPERFAVQFTASRATHDKLRYAQDLLGHAVPWGDIAEVIDRALDALVQQLEQRRFARASLKRPSPGSRNPRYIPAEVRRAVWSRDGGRCAFTSDQGRRCEERTRLEFDHVQPVARGGEATVANVRLCCRAHNQYEAEQVFGAGFMQRRREAAQSRSKPAVDHERSQDLVSRLRKLGLSAEQAARAAARSASIRGVPFEERLTLALRSMAPASVRSNAVEAVTSSR